jgi:ABC-type dipeptide/oligopeptide/nickel transport system permease component
MTRYLLRRLAGTCLLVLAVSSAAFVVTRLAPGDVAQTTIGFGASPAALERARREAHLDRPLVVQWGEWIGGAVRLDFGISAMYQRPVASLVGERALNTALLATAALVVALALGLPAAFVTATRPRSLAARAIRVLSLLLVSVPPFVGSLALVLLAVRTSWLPPGGMTSGGDARGLSLVMDVLWHLPLPVLALALPLAGTFERLQAQALTAALAEPSVHAARARGIPEPIVLRRHAWRLALKPVAAVAGLAFGALLSGSFVVELVTAWPGLGRLTYDALMHRDLQLVAGCAAAGTVLLAAGLFAADAVIAWSDPRVARADAREAGAAA